MSRSSVSNSRGIDWETEIRQVSGCRDRHAESATEFREGSDHSSRLQLDPPNRERILSIWFAAFDLSVEFGPDR